MSRHLSQRQKVAPSSDNPYQTTTIDYPYAHTHRHKNGNIPPDPRLAAAIYKNQQIYVNPNETCFTEDTYSESQYDYYHDHGYQTGNKKSSRTTDYTYSDDSESTRLPYYESEEPYCKRQTRSTSSDRSFRKTHFYKDEKNHALVQSDQRKMYPNSESACEVLRCENSQHCYNDITIVPASLPRRAPLSRVSDRPQSSQDSSVTSTVIHGCGGKCQTFENVCYYFLQVAFTMGILIGVPLSIAGAVLRKSAARNLQVLVYIGAMLSLVSALLLTVQCNAKRTAKNRKKALQKAKRAPIVLETIPPKVMVPYQQQPLMEDPQRRPPMTIIPIPAPVHHKLQRSAEPPAIIELPGVPWWRRKDLEQNR